MVDPYKLTKDNTYEEIFNAMEELLREMKQGFERCDAIISDSRKR